MKICSIVVCLTLYWEMKRLSCWGSGRAYIGFDGTEKSREMDLLFDFETVKCVDSFDEGNLGELFLQEIEEQVGLLVNVDEFDHGVERDGGASCELREPSVPGA